MTAVNSEDSLSRMKLWELTIVVVGLVWVIGSILVAVGATWLVHHQPD